VAKLRFLKLLFYCFELRRKSAPRFAVVNAMDGLMDGWLDE
jgi:hypothetical protein